MEDFEQQTGIHLLIEGKMTATSFNPMNIVAFKEKLLHQNFIQVSINNVEYLIQQPVIAYSNHALQKINKLHLILKNMPTENDGSLAVDGLGEIEGRYERINNIFHLYVNMEK